ncbi:UDP-N,N'-diacetylbacillosamine 2-epimerase (hydrolyzing) [compost metagenome]
MKKKVMIVTGTRADYGIFYPIMRAIQSAQDMDLQLLVTGMHLDKQYGRTIDYIEADGFTVNAVVDIMSDSTLSGMAKSIGLGIINMTSAIERLSPDCVIVLGDRGEMLAAAISSVHLNLPTLHLHGGEVSGSIDESVRHAISKLAHLHLVATDGSKERLIKMGEDPWRVHVTGAPRIETIENVALPDINIVKVKYGLDFCGDYGLFIYHPVTTEYDVVFEEMSVIFRALSEEKLPFVCVLPNSDAGSESIRNFYDSISDADKFYKVISFEQNDYLSILKHTSIMVGNSSSGIIEAASFKVPVINIGSRQYRRERSLNIIDINADYDQLKRALKKVESKEFLDRLEQVENVYYKKNTSSLVLDIIRKMDCYGKELIQKTIYY